jgi:regulator of protease activity HflC (stomatin/prohibitin superfamily)
METVIWILVLAGIGAAFLIVRSLFSRITIFEFERGLLYKKGKFDRVLEPGQYRIYRRSTTISKLDTRPRFVSVPGQEVLSSDSVTLRLSLAAEYSITDPAKAVNAVENYEDALYLTLQIALREVVGRTEIDELLEKRDEVGKGLAAVVAPLVAEFGLSLMSVDIKDIMFPGPLKKIFSSVVEARKEGLASLERARGESAALRNLANAARMIEGNPMLMHLRLLQEIGAASGNTIVLGLPGVTTPIPIREGESGTSPSAQELESPEE